LGACSGGFTGEHIVSAGLFDGDAITVKGFPWCLEEQKTIGLSSLTGTMLCKQHNNDLSPLDAATIDAFDILREIEKLYLLEDSRSAARGIEARLAHGAPSAPPVPLSLTSGPSTPTMPP
jgi:hypothetical protein